MVRSNGEKFNGGWVCDRKQGHGVMTYADGTLYEICWILLRPLFSSADIFLLYNFF